MGDTKMAVESTHETSGGKITCAMLGTNAAQAAVLRCFQVLTSMLRPGGAGTNEGAGADGTIWCVECEDVAASVKCEQVILGQSCGCGGETDTAGAHSATTTSAASAFSGSTSMGTEPSTNASSCQVRTAAQPRSSSLLLLLCSSSSGFVVSPSVRRAGMEMFREVAEGTTQHFMELQKQAQVRGAGSVREGVWEGVCEREGGKGESEGVGWEEEGG